MSVERSSAARPNFDVFEETKCRILIEYLPTDMGEMLRLARSSGVLGRGESLGDLDPVRLNDFLAKTLVKKFKGDVSYAVAHYAAMSYLEENPALVPDYVLRARSETVSSQTSQGRRKPLVAYRTLGLLSRLLPTSNAERYSEQWRCELYELQEEGARWYWRAGAVLQCVRAAVTLAVVLRLSRSRVIE